MEACFDLCSNLPDLSRVRKGQVTPHGHKIPEIRTTSLQGTVDLIPKCPLFRGSTVSFLKIMYLSQRR